MTYIVGNDLADKFMLEHYGVKGMKWGVRKGRRAERKSAKADSKWEGKQTGRKAALSIYSKAAEKANAELPGLNAKWAGKDTSKPGKTQDAYHKAVLDSFNKHVQSAASDRGVSPSGSKKLTASFDGKTGDMILNVVDIEHSSDSITLKVTRNSLGHIKKIDFPDGSLAHYGIKGMQWGVRKGNSAKEAKALSDSELKAAVARMNMEKQYVNLKGSPKLSKGKAFVAAMAVATVRQAVQNEAAKRLGAKLAQDSGKAAAASAAKKAAKQAVALKAIGQ